MPAEWPWSAAIPPAGHLTVSVQILGHVPRGTALRRSGARDGDLLAVTGTLGDAGAGLAFVTASAGECASRRGSSRSSNASTIRRPGCEFGVAARGIATAAMDLSDGLVGDLPKLAQASGLAAHVDGRAAAAVGRDTRGGADGPGARVGAWPQATTTNCCCRCRRRATANCEAAAAQLNLTLTAIGEMRSGNGVTWSLNGRDFQPRVPGFRSLRPSLDPNHSLGPVAPVSFSAHPVE